MTDSDQGSQGEAASFSNEGSSSRRRRSRRHKKDGNAQPDRAFVYSRDLGPGSKWRAKSDPKQKETNRLFLILTLVVIAILLIIGAFLLGRQTAIPYAPAAAPQAAGEPGVPALVTPGSAPVPSSERGKALVKLGQALDARAKGDARAAFDLLQEVKDLDPTIPGIRLLQARIAVSRRDYITADSLLLKSIRAKESAVESLNLRGSLLASQKAFREAYNCFTQSVEIDPLDPYAYFYWADALRGEGRSAEAIGKFEMAEKLATEQSDAFIIRAKLLLSKVEAEEENGAYSASLDTDAGKENTPGDVLLAAAAMDLKRSNYPRAIERLKLAREALQPGFFYYLASDPFFDFYRNREGVRELIGPKPAPAPKVEQAAPQTGRQTAPQTGPEPTSQQPQPALSLESQQPENTGKEPGRSEFEPSPLFK